MGGSRKRKCLSVLDKEDIEGILKIEGQTQIRIGGHYSCYNALSSLLEWKFVSSNEEEDVFDELPTEFVQCQKCFMVLSRGGNLKRHALETCAQLNDKEKASSSENNNNRKITEYGNNKLPENKKKQLLDIIVDYCLRTGVSFHGLESEEFQSFVVAVLRLLNPSLSKLELKNQMPCRATIQSSAEKKAQAILNILFTKLQPLFDSNRIAVVIDFGKQFGTDYLAVCLSYLDDDDNVWKQRVVPISFRPFNETSKNADEVFRTICEIGTEIGITKESLAKCHLVADGAANMKKCGEKYFQSYVRCSNHALHILAQRTLDPYKADMDKYSLNELNHLTKIQQLVTECRSLATYLRGDKRLAEKLAKLPNQGVETRWLSFVQCVYDVMSVLDFIADSLLGLMSPSMRSTVLNIVDNKGLLLALYAVLCPLLTWNEDLQGDDVTIHLIAPLFKQLLSKYEAEDIDHISAEEQQACDAYTVRVLSKSAYMVTTRHYDDLSAVHLSAAMLNPATKRMKQFSSSEISEAKNFINSLCTSAQPIHSPKKTVPNSQSRLHIASQMLADASSDEEGSHSELEIYLSEPIDRTETLETYWLRRKTQLPGLYSAVVRLFGIVSSEAACERSFSQSGRIINKFRTSLQQPKVDWIVTASMILKKFPELLTQL